MKSSLNRKEPRIPFTQKGYDKLLKERKVLLERRPEAVRNLAEARGMGDLSENGYYKASRAQLSFLDSRIRRVERLIRLAVIKTSTHVSITDGTQTYAYEIVGGYESDPSKHTISDKSPLGKAIAGKNAGEEVIVNTPSGVKKFTILHIS